MFDFARFYFPLSSLAKSNIWRNRVGPKLFVLAEILAVGHFYDLAYMNTKAEIFNANKNKWSRIDNYPFDKEST